MVIITEIIAPYRIPIFNALAQRKEIDLHVIFLSESDPSLRQWRVYKEEIDFHYEVLASWRRRFGRYNLLLNHGVLAALNRISPDVILCGGYNYVASWQAASWAKRRRVPFLLWSESTVLDNRRKHWPVEFMKTKFLQLSQGFVVPGRSSYDYLKELGIPGQQIFNAPNAVDTSLFSKLADQARGNRSVVQARRNLPSRYFLYVGRIVQAKGVFDLLDAYALLDKEVRLQVGLVFVGEGADRVELMKRALRIGPGDVRFFGFVHREQLPEFYALAEALVLPTHSDTWGLVVNEAMSCGLPVVATSVAGCVADLIQNGWNGFVVPPGSPAQLSASMTRLATDADLRIKMAANSLEWVQAYSPATWAEGLVQAVQFVRREAA
ncbi:MAG: glycosyltransferase family 4 protein [Candidatus Sulfotelmatobacter sp.]